MGIPPHARTLYIPRGLTQLVLLRAEPTKQRTRRPERNYRSSEPKEKEPKKKECPVRESQGWCRPEQEATRFENAIVAVVESADELARNVPGNKSGG